LRFDTAGLLGNYRGDEDSGPGKKTREVKWLEDGIVATLRGGVEEELVARIPEDAVGRELEEDLGVNAHLEGFDRDTFPEGEWRVESHQI